MRFDLVVNTFVKDALLSGALKLHGGGWMWRPLVDIRDCADAMIAAYEAPAEKVHGEIFNVVHSNYQIRELAMIVAGSVQLAGRSVQLEEVPAPKLMRPAPAAMRGPLSFLGWLRGARSAGSWRSGGRAVSALPRRECAPVRTRRRFRVREIRRSTLR